MDIKVQRITKTAKIPMRSSATATGYDLFADRVDYDDSTHQLKVFTGIAVQPEPGYYVEVYPRSSICKKMLQLANSVGIIDEDYTGEIILVFNMLPVGYSEFKMLWYSPASSIKVGEKIAQMVVRQRIDADFIEVSYLDNTVRGDGGFGSTGN